MTEIAITIQLPLPEPDIEIVIEQRPNWLDIPNIPIIIPMDSPCENLNTMAPRSGQIILSWPCSKRASPVSHENYNSNSKSHKH
jgi:hypothetical protein